MDAEHKTHTAMDKDMTPKELRAKHGQYHKDYTDATREMWENDADPNAIMRGKYTKDELALHVMLSHECFYCSSTKVREMPNALAEMQRCYRDTTMEDLEKVFNEWRGLVWETYG